MVGVVLLIIMLLLKYRASVWRRREAVRVGGRLCVDGCRRRTQSRCRLLLGAAKTPKCCIWGVLEGWQARYLVVRKSCCAARVQERQEQQRRAEREAAGKLGWFKLPAVMPMIQENPL